MTTTQLQDFQKRAITADNIIKSLQQQIECLRQELELKNNNDDIKQHRSPNTYQPDETYPVWYTPYNQIQQNQPDNIKVLNSLCPSEKVPFIPKNGRKSMYIFRMKEKFYAISVEYTFILLFGYNYKQ